eukprot:s1091_g8.t1
MAAAGHSSASDSAESVPAVQVYWTPNLGCHIRVSLATGAPEYGAYMKSASWVTRHALRTVGDGGVVIYPQAGNRMFPREAPVASMKLKPEGVPRHLGQQDVSAYFPLGETAVTEILEGQLAFLQHVHLYEENHLEGLTQEIDDISRLRHNYSKETPCMAKWMQPRPSSEELNEILRNARTNPWHLFKSGLLRRLDDTGMRMETPYGDQLVRITPFHSLPSSLKKLLGGELVAAPLSGYGLHFFLKAFELGKLTGNYLVEFQHKPKVYTNGYRSPYEKYEQRFPGGIAAMLNALTEAQQMEFRPLADYAEKLRLHNAFLMERDVYREVQYIRDDFSLLTSVVAEAYGPDFFSYITRNSADHEMRKKYRIISAEGYPLYDSTLREPFNASYILACLERTLQSTEGQGKDFKSSFARKAKSDLSPMRD